MPNITVPSFAPSSEGVDHFFGTRLSPLSVTPGRPLSISTGRSNDVAAPVLLSVNQVHGTDALVVDQPIRGGESFDGGWDALVTDQPGIMVAVRTADCVPVLLHDPVQRVVAAIHAGWRGAVAGIVPKTVALLLRRFGARAERLRMAIGPSAGPCCYEVDEPVLSRLREVFPAWHEVVQPTGVERARLDLRAFVQRQGLANGLRVERIEMVNACTICHADLFYSYRREGVVKATMVSGIALQPQPRS
ncbi:MAG TPA: peptidoglycan editing factor PgeF [Nitrospira sp.]|jgi:YfiH family protein|nr:peptidoglycan editing factor PgeF [Nitrospira sp.]